MLQSGVFQCFPRFAAIAVIRLLANRPLILILLHIQISNISIPYYIMVDNSRNYCWEER